MEHPELMIKRIYRQSAFVIGALAIITLFFRDWRFSLGIVIGGLAGEVNLRGIVWSVRALLGTEKAQTKMMVLSMFRLLVIFSILIILAIFKVIKPYGLLIGFTVVFIIIVKEGLIAAKKGA
ncbi:ATP synthase subunit I [Dissulfurispira sp.]|uniref:ATP synthase subunit I n=1 Tax=Dissulfurispira sp. TaxID=2817609 RepID=UPI002FDB19B0